MEQLTWLQQSLQKPRLSAVARVLAEAFPRQGVPPVVIGESNAILGTYNSASKLNAEHLEYPGYILRYREFNAGGNYIGYGWARRYTDHIGILGGQVTVANDGFFAGVQSRADNLNPWSVLTETPGGAFSFGARPRDDMKIEPASLSGFASLVPVHSGLMTGTDGGPLVDSDGILLLTEELSFEEPASRGFCSIQWLTESETRRSQ